MARGRTKPELVKLDPLEKEGQWGTPQCARPGCTYQNYYMDHDHYSYGEQEFILSSRAGESIRLAEPGEIFFKWLEADGTPIWGGRTNVKWSLPTDEGPGGWFAPDSDKIAACDHGLHGLLPGQSIGTPDRAVLFQMEIEGPFINTTNKVVAGRARLVRQIDTSVKNRVSIERAAWKLRRAELMAGTYKPHPYYSGIKLTAREKEQFLKTTQAASYRAIARAAKVAYREYRSASIAMARTEAKNDNTYRYLAGLKGASREDWDGYQDLVKRRRKAQRTLSRMERVRGTFATDLDPRVLPNSSFVDPMYVLHLKGPEKKEES